MIPLHQRQDLKGPEEHLQFLKDFAQVKFFSVFQKFIALTQHEPDNPPRLQQLVERQTFLMNLTTFHNDALFESSRCTSPETWSDLLETLEHITLRTVPESLEKPQIIHWALQSAEKAVHIFDGEDLFAPRVDRDLDDLHQGRILGQYTDSIFYAHSIVPYRTTEGEEMEGLEFHIGNAAYPRSFFEDQELLNNSHDYLLKTARTLSAATLVTTTWLNSLPKWIQLFPPSWRQNLGQAMGELGPNLGCWGQFISSRQALNRRTATAFFQTGKVPYPMRLSWCTLGDFENYWNTQLPTG